VIRVTLTATIRKRLKTQGFRNIDDETLAQVEPWLRWSPALCATIAAVGTALASPAVLWGLAPFAALGAILPFHPFDLVYNLGLRRLTRTPALPPNGAPRRFACAMAAVWLSVTGVLFATGAAVAGYALGGLFVLTAGIVSTTHFCIPSTIYGLLFGRAGSSSKPAPERM
jgi:hypothetical protein